MQDNQNKKVFIFAGETTPDFERNFTEAVKKEGASAAFINVPKPAIAQPNVEVELKAAENVCKLYKGKQTETVALFERAVNRIHLNTPKCWFEIKTIHHLCDRIIHAPGHVVTLHLKDPIYSYVDSASINRSMFESAVNCLYLLQDNTGLAFSSLISKSFDDDIKREIELSSWAKHPDPRISKAVASSAGNAIDRSVKQKLLKAWGLPQNAPPFPDIKNVVKSLEIGGSIYM